jgi:hypothetical protein
MTEERKDLLTQLSLRHDKIKRNEGENYIRMSQYQFTVRMIQSRFPKVTKCGLRKLNFSKVIKYRRVRQARLIARM